MLAIPEPSLCDDPAESGTFVVVALDPVASVGLLDEQAKQEAAAMIPAKYLALLDGHSTTEYGWDGLLRLSPLLLLAGPGLPAPPYSWAAIPVYPTPAHPETGRPAVETLTPMHWAHCYIHTLSTVSGLISSLYQHPTVGPVLSPEAYERVTDEVIDDSQNVSVDLTDGTEFERPDICELLRDEPFVLDTEPGGRDSIITDLFTKDETPRMKLSFKMWVDTSSLSELGDPDNIEGEIARLKHAPLIGIGADVDSLVHPEDAVDHRFERGWALKGSHDPVPPFTLPSRSPSPSSLPSPSTDTSARHTVPALIGLAHEQVGAAVPRDRSSASEISRSSAESVSGKRPFHIPIIHAALTVSILRHAISAGLTTFVYLKSITWDRLLRLSFRSR
ncbi:hypothetical protein AURDEDRAFT_168260 [Auricularia subglabra TFB-10046 SS5]|nr:hypothetical protein AURDEDRAFT_168260 [Auricularia subglabra TFB-10046 SS5]